MWESLATTRRQDRVLHGAAKALNVAAGLGLAPLWLGGQRVAGLVADRLARAGAQPRDLPVPPERDGQLDSIVSHLQALPHRLRPTEWALARKGMADLSLFMLSQKRPTANLGYAYPRQFAYHYFDGADGERLAAAVAAHERPRPGLVVVHGLLSSRLFDYVREIAVRAYYDWGFNVAVIDLRSFGLTEMLTRAPNTGGWKEGEDVLCAARCLKELGSTSVGALGISLGASSVMGASHPEGADELLDGGILAICGPGDVRRATAHIDRERPRSDPFYPVARAFHSMLLSKVRSLGWPAEVASFHTLMEVVVGPHYGLSADEVYERSSAANHVERTRTPLLVLHAADDPVVPIEHARLVEAAAHGNPNVRVWIVPGGSHAAFDALDRRWTYTVYREWFERLARYVEREAGYDGRVETSISQPQEA